jgi:RecA/RadA recombinase
MAAKKKKRKAPKKKSTAKKKRETEAVPQEAVAEALPSSTIIEPWPSTQPQDVGPMGSKLRGALRAFRNQINTQAERKIMGFASEACTTQMLRRPSGITELDIATGGGLPAGGPVQIAGPEAVGKTYLAMQYMKMHQLLYGDASSMLYVCTEPALGFDFSRAAKMGLRVGLPRDYIPELQKIRIERGQSLLTENELNVLMGQVGELMIVQAHTGEEALTTVLRAVEQKLFGIIVVDSMTNVLPGANADRDLDDENKRAARATLITDFVMHYTPLINKFGEANYTTLIGVSQARAKQNKTEYDKDWEVPIAYAWRHAILQNILIWNGAQIKKTRHKVPGVVGKGVHWSIGKGKAGAHEHVKGTYDFFFDDVFPDLNLPYGVDRFETLLLAGMRFGVIREHKSKIYLVRAKTGEAFVGDIPGLPKLKEGLRIDFSLEMALRHEVMAARGIECRYL